MHFIILQQQERRVSMNSMMEISALYNHLMDLLTMRDPDIVVSTVYKGCKTSTIVIEDVKSRTVQLFVQHLDSHLTKNHQDVQHIAQIK